MRPSHEMLRKAVKRPLALVTIIVITAISGGVVLSSALHQPFTDRRLIDGTRVPASLELRTVVLPATARRDTRSSSLSNQGGKPSFPMFPGAKPVAPPKATVSS